MPNIELRATLQAYSRVPFFLDYIREADKDGKSYVRKDGEWIPLDTTLLLNSLEEFKDIVNEVGTNLTNINLYLDVVELKLVFVNSYGTPKFINLPKTKVDGLTIGYRETDNVLYQLDTPDNKTLKVVNEKYSQSIEDIDIQNKISGELRVDAIYAESDDLYITGQSIYNRLNSLEKNVIDLELVVQGTGGYLDPYYFYNDGKYNTRAIPLVNLGEHLKDSILTQYAYDQLAGRPLEDQTKIKDLFDFRIWVYTTKTGTWVDEGQDTVVTANNLGVMGSVTGVKYDPENKDTKFKISIDTYVDSDGIEKSLGTMSVNGLKEEFSKVLYKEDSDSSNISGGTLVVRTENGTIRANDPIEDQDVVTLAAFNRWIEESSISEEEIDALFPELGGI